MKSVWRAQNRFGDHSGVVARTLSSKQLRTTLLLSFQLSEAVYLCCVSQYSNQSYCSFLESSMSKHANSHYLSRWNGGWPRAAAPWSWFHCFKMFQDFWKAICSETDQCLRSAGSASLSNWSSKNAAITMERFIDCDWAYSSLSCCHIWVSWWRGCWDHLHSVFGTRRWLLLNTFSFLNWYLVSFLGHFKAFFDSILYFTIYAISKAISFISNLWCFCDLQKDSERVASLSSPVWGSLRRSLIFYRSCCRLLNKYLCYVWDQCHLQLASLWFTDPAFHLPSSSWSSLTLRMFEDSLISWIWITSLSHSGRLWLQHLWVVSTSPPHACFHISMNSCCRATWAWATSSLPPLPASAECWHPQFHLHPHHIGLTASRHLSQHLESHQRPYHGIWWRRSCSAVGAPQLCPSYSPRRPLPFIPACQTGPLHRHLRVAPRAQTPPVIGRYWSCSYWISFAIKYTIFFNKFLLYFCNYF